MTFSSNVLKVLRGTAAAQVIGLLSLPIMSRLFSPDAFGALQAMLSVLSLLLVVCSLRLDIAILSVSDTELPVLVECCLWLCLATSALVFVVDMVLLAFFSGNASLLAALLYILPLTLLAAGFGQILSYIALRRQQFGLSANAKIAQAATFSISSVGIGLALPSAIGLALGDLAGRVLQSVALLRSGNYTLVCLSSRISRAALASLWSAHRTLPLVALPGAVINVLGSSYTPLMLLMIFSAHEAGQYALVERALGGPIGMISGATAQVFIAGFAEAGRKAQGSQRDMVRKLVVNQLRLGIIPATLIFFLAPTLLPFVLGSDWGIAGLYAQVLAPLFLVSFIVGPVNMALTVGGHQVAQFAWDLGRLVVVGLAWLVIYWMQLNAHLALWIYCAAACLCYLSYLVILDATLNRSDRVVAISEKTL